jgi:transcriptional regulator with XRE-family HTH domain
MDTSDGLQQQFGERVRDLRKKKGLSQEAFSFECSLDRTYVSQVEQGRRNISLRNIKAMADALGISVAELFSAGTVPLGNMAAWEPSYRMNDDFSINRGFEVNADDVRLSAINVAKQLRLLPFSLYQSIDLKTLSSIVGAIFAGCLASEVGAIVNPIEKGHPDIIPSSGRSATEAQLRNYPEGLEIKVTVGNVAKGSNLQPGTPRIAALTAITWQAHHREVESLLGLSIDFAGETHDGKRYPMITGAFFTDELAVDDWGEISGTTGRNTKVTGMRSSGKAKMGNGWVLLIEDDTYITKYSELLNFAID